jgi:hypothetical protein
MPLYGENKLIFQALYCLDQAVLGAACDGGQAVSRALKPLMMAAVHHKVPLSRDCTQSGALCYSHAVGLAHFATGLVIHCGL